MKITLLLSLINGTTHSGETKDRAIIKVILLSAIDK